MRRGFREQLVLLGALSVAVISLVFAYQSEEHAKKTETATEALRTTFERRFLEFDALLDRTERSVLSLKQEGYVEADDFSSFADGVKRASVMIVDEGEVVGSGFFIEDGIIATAAHVVDEVGDDLQVQTFGSGTFSGELLAKDQASDVALVRIKKGNFPSVVLGYFENIEVGEEIGIAGFSGGLSQILIHRGVISAKGEDNGIKRLSINAFVNKGNSGGPIFSALTGRVIGIVSSRQIDVPTEKFIALPPNYSSGFAISGLDPVKFNVDLYNETVKLVGDVSQVGIGFGTASEHIRTLLQEIR
ncbi:MAG: trypsin-like peptidase domain-containing protein [Candidatus Niyogibacteria bacterium]|nr:trypsin-like peptidase domain-containing protein [Candidatus Niyogibacteria bacterium]